MPRLFFLLSGEHESLPLAELESVLEAESFEYEFVEELDQVARIEVDPECASSVKKRTAFTRLCGLELFYCAAEISEIMELASDPGNFNRALAEGETFAVRVKRVKGSARRIDGRDLERRLGEVILRCKRDTRVDLVSPDRTFIGIIADGRFVFGTKLSEVQTKPFFERRPGKKPFFHPSAMQPKLARCMVNLAHARAGDLIYDPFCGTGGILIEAACIQCHVLGSDVKRKMVEGSYYNMNRCMIRPEGLVVADARTPPVTKVDCIVGDPPYGRSATTLKRTTKQIVKDTLVSGLSILSKGQRICVAAPKTAEIGALGDAVGFKHVESHYVYVHRSLTREIAVFERV